MENRDGTMRSFCSALLIATLGLSTFAPTTGLANISNAQKRAASRREALLKCTQSLTAAAGGSLVIGAYPSPVAASPTKIADIYDAVAESYDELYGKSKVGATLDLNEVRLSTLAPAKGSVLELGVGTGLNLPFYPSGVTSLSAVDLSPAMLAKAKEKAQYLPPTVKSVEFKVGDVSKLPFPDATFDCVVDTFGLCVFEDPGAVLREARRVLVQGGLLLISETQDSVQSRLMGAVRISDVSRSCRSDDDVIAFVKASGFEVLETETVAGGLFRRVVARNL
mmetsp:Transcript_31920/g.52670  ORF Transcript_31920/g.52670 Transcript_31920/m.52670 type:complete len:280 (-) Transcript_31920:32-871(-)